jgi:outer membrane immunogenic protein
MKDKTMKKTLLAAVVMSMPVFAGSALAADLAIKTPSAHAFSWSSCYLGMHAGGAFASKDMTDPVALAEGDAASQGALGAYTSVTTANVSPSGAVVGGQLGCDYQFAPNWVAGIEGMASGSDLLGGTTVGLPGGYAGENASVSSRTTFLSSVTGRLGYAIDHTLFYGKAGVAWADNRYDVTGSYQGAAVALEGFDTRTGWTAGAGVEWAFSRNWSVNLEYDYYSFGRGTALLSDSGSSFSGPLDAKQSIQVVKAGVNFHMWSGQ